MSFDNDYPNRKDRRRPFYNSGRYSTGCRHGGDCEWCRGNRTHRNKKHEPIVTEEEMNIEMCRVQEDYEQQCDLPPEEYLLWLEGMAKKYPEIGFYQYRLRNEKTYQHTAEELFPDDD